jgi:hypothetical protein
MSNFYNYSQKNTNVGNLKNSLIVYLPQKNQNLNTNYFKTNSAITGFYKDKIINDFIYIASSGFKKDHFFKKNQLISLTNKSLNLNFISYFSLFNYKFLNIFLYPRIYYNIFFKQYLKKKFYILNYLKKKNKKIKKKIISFF